MSIENCIKEIRLKKGVTQEDLAQVVGVSRQTIVAIEKGNYVPSLLLAFKLSDYFGISVERLFKVK